MATALATFPSHLLPFVTQQDELTQIQTLFEQATIASAPRAARLLRDYAAKARAACRTEAEWRNRVDTELRAHPVFPYTQLDAFVRRCFDKPRGYAGDAAMLDYIYHHPSTQFEIASLPPAVQSAMQFTTNSPAPRAVRNRAFLLAQEIDATAARTPNAEVLSLACGHLREATSVQSKLKRFVAIDQDTESLKEVARHHPNIEATEGSVKTVIAKGRELGQFDFVYAAGLYDYLNDKVAARLLQALFDRLKPGGKLWIANFMPDIADRGFMEAYMDWWLIYRDERDMMKLAEALPANASFETFVEHEQNIVFLEAVRNA